MIIIRISFLLLAVSLFPSLTKAKRREIKVPSILKGPKRTRVGKCTVSKAVIQEIASYAPIVAEIAREAINGSHKGYTYDHLADLVDLFGDRFTGSEDLEDAIDYMIDLLKHERLENVHTEYAEVTHWVRGRERAALITPRYEELTILGLGGSIGTPHQGIRADILVVKNFDELKYRADEAVGKIVVFNQDFTTYGESMQYREYGAIHAASVGAVAVLIRSVTPFSINSPHTGLLEYADNVTKIPAASITVEDAEMLWRMATRLGLKMRVKLEMGAKTLPTFMSRNTVAEFVGSSNPEEVVLVSGHLDSWDVGQGAMDDGAGAFISWSALSLLKKLGLRPRRTMRAVLWTGEEVGLLGAQAYYEAHENEMEDFDLVMESDSGTFHPTGFSFSGSKKAACIMQEVVKLLAPLGANELVTPAEGTDISVFTGVPQAALLDLNDKYFWYHHSEGDVLSILDSDVLDICTAIWASAAYVVADIEDMLPR